MKNIVNYFRDRKSNMLIDEEILLSHNFLNFWFVIMLMQIFTLNLYIGCPYLAWKIYLGELHWSGILIVAGLIYYMPMILSVQIDVLDLVIKRLKR